MPELLTALILLIGLLIAGSMVHAGRKVKAYLRLRRRRKASDLSRAWWTHHERQQDRIEYHGPKIAWPIRKED